MKTHLSIAVAAALLAAGCQATINTTAPGTGSTGTTTGASGSVNVGAGATTPDVSKLGAAITHSADISASETWKKGLHVVDGTINVTGQNAPVLTIEAGSVVKFTPGSQLIIHDNGGLVATGTAGDGNGILFTSNNPSGSVNKGDWVGIVFANANSAQCQMAYCTVEDAGTADPSHYTSDGAAIYAEGANFKLSLDHVTVRNSKNYGIQFKDAHPSTLTNCMVTTCDKMPLALDADAVGNIGAGNQFTGNATDVVQVNSGQVVQDATWTKQGVPYRVFDGVRIGAQNGATVTIQPGTTLQMAQGAGIDVGSDNPGALSAAGTADAPITFTSLPNAKNAGEWGGLGFWSKANVGKCKLDHCVIEYAGGANPGAHDNASLFTEVVFPITNTAITNSASYGIFQSGLTLTLGADVTFSANATANLNTP